MKTLPCKDITGIECDFEAKAEADWEAKAVLDQHMRTEHAEALAKVDAETLAGFETKEDDLLSKPEEREELDKAA